MPAGQEFELSGVAVLIFLQGCCLFRFGELLSSFVHLTGPGERLSQLKVESMIS